VTVLTHRGFSSLYAHVFQKPRAADAFLGWSRAPKAVNVGYWPGEPLFHQGNLNKYRGPELKPDPGQPWSHIQALLDALFPIEEEQAHVLDVLAHLVHHPGRKIRHALHVRGPQGTGKNTLFETLLKLILGPENVHRGDGTAADSRWIDWMFERQVVVIDEVQQEGGWHLQNKLKPAITEEVHNVESKNVDFANRTTARLYVILSNSENHLPIEDGDRRAWVATYGLPRKEPEFYDRLHDALPREAAGFLHALLTRSISHFSPDKAPPMTEAKAQLAADCRPPLQRHLGEMLEGQIGPFAYDLVVPRHLQPELRIANFSAVTDEQIRSMLRRLGCRPCASPLPAMRELGPQWASDVRVWAVRNVEFLSTASKAELKAHMLGQFRTGRTAA